ncbi:hypothetical protein ACFMQL_36100 [Nonomuraea fastidiosa]
MTETARAWSGSLYDTLAAGIVQVRAASLGGAGFLIAPDLVLTCAHVVSDALGRPRDDKVAAGTPVRVELPLAEPPPDGGPRTGWPASVET